MPSLPEGSMIRKDLSTRNQRRKKKSTEGTERGGRKRGTCYDKFTLSGRYGRGGRGFAEVKWRKKKNRAPILLERMTEIVGEYTVEVRKLGRLV